MRWMKRPPRYPCRNAHPCAGFAQKYTDGSYHAKTNLTWRAVKNTTGLEVKTVFDSSGLIYLRPGHRPEGYPIARHGWRR